MKMLAATLLLLAATTLQAQQTRIASDFEIAQMEAQLARSKDFVSQLSARLNLGDLRTARNERTLAAREYQSALALAQNERVRARRESDLTQYANATAYAAVASAKLGSRGESVALADEALRYESGSAKTWNLTASAYTLVALDAKAVSAARNAVVIAEADLARSGSVANRLDLAVYRHALASSLVAMHRSNEAERILTDLAAELDGPAFEGIRREVARSESFEVYSTARGDAAAWLSLVNRVNLRLASLLEVRDVAAAKARYRRVLQSRSDDPAALTALARLAASASERQELFANAFDANPFSLPLIRSYQVALGNGLADSPQGESPGAMVRRAILAASRGERRAARTTLESLQRRFPDNQTLAQLLAEATPADPAPEFLSGSATHVVATAAQLGALLDLLADDRLTSAQRGALDRIELTANATLADSTASGETTTASRGLIETTPFRFAQPTAFRGTFPASVALTFRVLGATTIDGKDALLLEPLRMEARP